MLPNLDIFPIIKKRISVVRCNDMNMLQLTVIIFMTKKLANHQVCGQHLTRGDLGGIMIITEPPGSR